MTSPKRSLSTRIASLSAYRALRILAVLAASCISGAAAHAVTATTTTLAISSTNVPYKTPITLTATVKAGGSPVTSGLVLFCDATALFCENNSSLLAEVQLTASTATAVVKIGSGPLGVHSYKAVYRANNTYGSSISNTVSYNVQGTYASSTVIGSSGTVGNYTLASTVSGVGANTSPGPSGTVSFVDTSAGNNILGTSALGAPTLTNTFSQAPNSPFAIGDGKTTLRSVVVASAYLDGDNNIDVVTGDADQVITVLLGNGDGTFKPKVNYPGCPSISSSTNVALKILLADFNRDGFTDIALGCSDGSNGGVGILLGNGDGSFQPVIWNSTGDLAGVAMGDFNGDGILDLAVTSRSQQNVRILRGNGDGTFQSPVTAINTPKAARDIVVADLNGDGFDDLGYAVATATPASTLSDLYVALGKGDGTFKPAVLQASQIGEFLTTGDTNGDNIADIISCTVTLPGPSPTSHISNSMFVLIGNGDGTFKSTVTYVSDIPSDPHLADVDGDGKVDIIAGGSYGALVYHGNGDGTFKPYDEPVIGGFALTYAVNAADYNNDGNADLIGTDASSPRAAVALSDVKQASDAGALTGIAVFPLGSGIHQVDASYSGDSIYLASVSSTVPLRAAPTPTTLTLSVAPAMAVASGQSVTLTATLSPYTIVGPPSTTTDGQTVSFYNGSTLIGTGTLSGGVATLTTTTLPAGSDTLKATYPGDVNYNPSTSSTVNVTVSSVALASAPNPSNYGQTVTLTATVATGATGSVTFKDGSTTLGTATISGTTASMTTSTLTVGSHSLTAVYNGDGTHSTATSAVVTQVVNKINPAMSVTTSGQSTYLSPVTITATVPNDATGTVTFTSGSTTLGTATISGGSASITTTSLPVGNNTITASYPGDNNYNPGTATTTRTVTKASPSSTLTSSANPSIFGSSVTFTDTLSTTSATGTVTFTAGATTLGTVNVVNGVASVSTSTLAVGNTTITATYNGDTNNNTSVASLVQAVAKASPGVTLTSSLNPSTVGQSVTFTATLPSGVTGTVTFTSGTTALGTATIASGVASVSSSSLPAGTNTITAQYSGDANNNTASATLNQVVNKANPTLTVTTSGPSTYGASVTITATLPSGVTGTVTFTNGGATLGTATVSGGVATIATSTLPVGSDTITATYSGDANNNMATGTVVQVVSKVSPTSTLTSSANPASAGSSITFTDTLPTNATGTVTFTSGSTVIGTSTVSGGVATVTTSTLPVGSSTITASYGGDSNYNTSTATLTQVVTKNNPTLTVTTSAPAPYGSTVTITATLPAGVTGSVTFTSGATSLGTAPINGSGVATISTSVLPVGSNTITASYAGDSNNNAATGTGTQVILKNTPTVTVTTSGPSTVGSSVTITATVPPSATGTVTFTAGSTTLGTSTVNNGTATITTTTLPVGTTTITATYNGDNNNNPATGTTTQTVSKASPTLNLVSSLNPAAVGQSVTFTATLPPAVTGTVTFSNGSTVLGTATVSGGIASVSTSSLPLGANTITATYSGDASNNTATASLVENINQNVTTVTVTTSGPSTYGNPVTITATVPSSATGTVTFTSGGTTIGTSPVSGGTAVITTSTLPVGVNTITATYNGDTNYGPGSGSTTQTVSKVTPPITVTTSGPSNSGDPVTITTTLPPGTTGTVTVSAGGTTIGVATVNPTTGTATVITSTLPIGTTTITASYGGDTNNNPATGSTTQVVNKATPAVSLTSSLNPSTYGQAVTFTATVPASATGTITFLDGGSPIGSGTVTNGVAVLTTSTLGTGSHIMTASYSGDSKNNAATSAPLTQTVGKFTPVLPPPGVSSTTPPPNTPVTITEQVPPGVTGTVTFNDGTTVLGTAPIVGGTATLTVPSLPIGSNPITASVPETSTYNSATSPATTVTVGKTTPTVTLISSVNPSAVGQAVIFTASVPTAATGTITFTEGATVLGTATVTNGQASITDSALSSGTHTIIATYSGDTAYNTAASAPLTQTVGKATPTVTLISSVNPSAAGQAVIFTASVPTAATGTITFTEGATVLGTATVTNGQASITDSALSSGTHTIIATYSGDTAYNTAVSAPLTQTVGKATPTLPPPVVSNPTETYGGTETITETIPPGVSGPITFYNGGTPIGTAPVVGGVATITVPNLPVGSNPITASTPGDANNNPATSPATIVTVTKTTPVLPAPGVSNANPSPNTPVTITEQVPSGVTGPITFSNGSTVLGTAPVVNGVATLTVPSLPIGSNPITASVAETATSNAATSPATTVTVGLTTPTVTLASSANPAAAGQSITFTASLPAGATGTITFRDGTTVLGTGAVSGAGVATFTTSTLAIGTHPITASYGGDSSHNTAVSPTLSQIVGKLPTTITLAASSGTTMVNGTLTLTAVVSSTAPTPTGSVTFLEGTTTLGTAALSTNGGVVGFQLTGNAALAISTLSSGSHTITAVYSGDAAFLTSTSAPVTVLVHDFTNKNTGAANANIFPGDSATYKFTLTPVGTTTFPSNVNLTVSGLPQGTEYTFSPASINGGAGGTEVTLTLKTSKSLRASNQVPARPGSHEGSSIAVAMLGLAGLGAVRRYRRKMPRLLVALLLLAGSLLPVASLTGCAGGYFTLTPTPYTVTVTGTEGTIQHSATATLNVQ